MIYWKIHRLKADGPEEIPDREACGSPVTRYIEDLVEYIEKHLTSGRYLVIGTRDGDFGSSITLVITNLGEKL